LHSPVPPICGSGQRARPPDFRWDETPSDEGIERDGGFLIRQVSVAECAGSLLEKGIRGQFAQQQS
jgi:hypothetical protein